jgi:MFS family permease
MPERTPRNVYAFGLTSFFNDTASEMAYWVLPAFLATIGAGPAQLGIIEGIAESVASFAKLVSGHLADRLDRRKPLVVTGYFVANAVKPLLALTSNWFQILGIRFADRFSKGVRGTARDVMVAESVPRGHSGAAYGLIQTMDSAGAIAGPAVALAVLAMRESMRTVFWVAAVPGALCVLVALFGIKETTRGEAERETNHVAPKPPSAADRLDTPELNSSSVTGSGLLPSLPWAFYYVLGAVTLFSLGNSSDMFLVLRAESVGIPAEEAPLLGLVFNVTYTLLAWPAGRVSDRWPRRRVAAAGYLVFAIVYVVFALAPSRTGIWAAMAVYGLFYALTAPVLKALVVETVGEEVRGRALGVFFFATSVATLLASVITGELWKRYGATTPFGLSAAAAGIAALLLLVGSGGKSR